MEKVRSVKKDKAGSNGTQLRSDIVLSGPISISNASVCFGNTINIGARNSSADKVLKAKTPVVTAEIKEFFQCSELVNATHRVVASRHIGYKWRHVGKELAGLSDGELDTLENDYKSQELEEIVYQMLLKWANVKGSGATLGVLSKTLWKHKVYDAVTDLIECCCDSNPSYKSESSKEVSS